MPRVSGRSAKGFRQKCQEFRAEVPRVSGKSAKSFGQKCQEFRAKVPRVLGKSAGRWRCMWHGLSVFRVSGNLILITRHSSFIIHHSSLVIHHSSLVIRHSSFIIHHSSLVIRHSSFIIRHSSFVTRHSSSVIHLSTVQRYGILCFPASEWPFSGTPLGTSLRPSFLARRCAATPCLAG